jgi:hypothetical protein
MNVETTGDSPRWAGVQGVLARGDRRVADALVAVDGHGLSAWQRALRTSGIDPDNYLRQRPTDEMLPWSVVAGQACAGEPASELVSQGAA